MSQNILTSRVKQLLILGSVGKPREAMIYVVRNISPREAMIYAREYWHATLGRSSVPAKPALLAMELPLVHIVVIQPANGAEISAEHYSTGCAFASHGLLVAAYAALHCAHGEPKRPSVIREPSLRLMSASYTKYAHTYPFHAGA